MLSERTWQRDLLRILLYVAGVVIAVMAIPAVIMILVVVVLDLSERPGGGFRFDGWAMILQQAVPVLAGLLLARLSGWLAGKVFPDQPTARASEPVP